jgi:hypothetical protein
MPHRIVNRLYWDCCMFRSWLLSDELVD